MVVLGLFLCTPMSDMATDLGGGSNTHTPHFSGEASCVCPPPLKLGVTPFESGAASNLKCFQGQMKPLGVS